MLMVHAICQIGWWFIWYELNVFQSKENFIMEEKNLKIHMPLILYYFLWWHFDVRIHLFAVNLIIMAMSMHFTIHIFKHIYLKNNPVDSVIFTLYVYYKYWISVINLIMTVTWVILFAQYVCHAYYIIILAVLYIRDSHSIHCYSVIV